MVTLSYIQFFTVVYKLFLNIIHNISELFTGNGLLFEIGNSSYQSELKNSLMCARNFHL